MRENPNSLITSIRPSTNKEGMVTYKTNSVTIAWDEPSGFKFSGPTEIKYFRYRSDWIGQALDKLN